MADRLGLHTVLQAIIGSDNVYFQPPPNVEMRYPCIVYNRSDIRTDFGNNLPYNLVKEYTLTLIDRNPDSQIPDQLAALPKCDFVRHYTTSGLNHDVFTIFY